MNSSTYTYNVMVIDAGYSEIHTEDLTENEAHKLRDKLAEMFPDYTYYVERVLDPLEPRENVTRRYNSNAVDGWEDFFPDRD